VLEKQKQSLLPVNIDFIFEFEIGL